MPTDKPFSPSCDRNRDPILAVLSEHFADRRHVLEIGSGTGQHAAYFAAAMPWLRWQCSDVADNLPGVCMWLEEAGLPNTPAPIELDVRGPWRLPPLPLAGEGWGEGTAVRHQAGEGRNYFDAAFSANTLHIMGWPEVEAMFAGLDAVLARDAALAIYGPFNYGGGYSSDSNRDFDGWLKARDPRSGIRDFEAVDALARNIGLHLVADVAMPANNRTLVWHRGITVG